jgi:hypothetical protein
MDFNKDLRLSFPKHKLTVKKLIYVLLKKLDLKHILYNIYVGNYSIELSFKETKEALEYDNETKYFYQNEDNNELVHFKTKVKKNDFRDKSSKLFYEFKIAGDSELIPINIYKNYLTVDNFAKNNAMFTLSKSFNIFNNDLDDPYFQQKMNGLYKSILFFDNHQNNFLPFIIYLDAVSGNLEKVKQSKDVDISLNSASKFYSFKSLFEVDKPISLPKQESKNKVIDIILKNRKLFQKSTLNLLRANGTNYTITIDKRDKTNISFNGFTVFTGKYINRFKYIDHPGLNFFTKYLEYVDQIDTFDYQIQKVLLKTL